MNALGFIFTLFLPETKGLSLEEMDVLFGVIDEDTRRHDIEAHVNLPATKELDLEAEENKSPKEASEELALGADEKKV